MSFTKSFFTDFDLFKNCASPFWKLGTRANRRHFRSLEFQISFRPAPTLNTPNNGSSVAAGSSVVSWDDVVDIISTIATSLFPAHMSP